MINYVKRSIGLRLFVVHIAMLSACVLFVVAFSSFYSRDFSRLAIAENEQYVKEQALVFLAETTRLNAQKYEAVFEKLAAYSRSTAKQAELRLHFAGGPPRNIHDVSRHLILHPPNGIFYNDRSAPMMICYWGGATVPAKVAHEIELLAPLASNLAEAKENNPEVAASHLIMTTGFALYYPNVESVLLLPPVTELDLRDMNNYVLASPRNNPERQTVWVPVYFDDVGNGLMTTVTSPIYGEDGVFYGVSGLDVPLDRIHKHIMLGSREATFESSKSIVSVLLDDHGKFISFPLERLAAFGIESDIEKYRNSSDLLDKGLSDSTLPEVRALGETIADSPNQSSRFLLRGDPYLVSSRLLPANGWRLVTLMPEVAFLAPVEAIAKTLTAKIRVLNNRFYLTAILFLLGTLVLTILFLKRFFLHPLHQIATAAESIKEGNFDSSLDLKRVDEIGSLAESFNIMASSLQQSKTLERNYANNLKEQVAAQTLELNNKNQLVLQTLRELESDIARRKQAESELIQEKRKAEAANQAKSDFLSNMTHELRTPLVGVLGMNELLLKTPLTERQKKLVLTAQRSGENLLSLISDILDFSKLESVKLLLQVVPVSLSEVVEETVLLLADQAEKKGLNLVCQIAPSARWVVSADPTRLRQILLNLVSNAVKFTSQGEISVRLAMSSRLGGFGCFTFEVDDAGIGMTREQQEKVFAPFVQVDSTSTRAYGGAGLGLAIVTQLVELMDGKLELESQVGQGSLFRVVLTLPLVTHQKPECPESLKGSRVLLQKNEPRGRDALEKMLSFLGMTVVAAASEEEAWQRLLDDRQAGLSFDIAMISTAGRVLEDVLLYKEICNEKSLDGMQIIALNSRLSMSEPDPPRLFVLEEPVTWAGLLMSLDCCVSELRQSSAPLACVLCTQPSMPTEEESTENRSEPRRGRILIVDDYPVTRELVQQSLIEDGLCIDEASSGWEVLKMAQNTTYGLVLMDCNMPGMDGLETTRQLRLQGHSVPIVALTAHVDSRIYEDCLSAGMNDYLSKPFRRVDLVDMVNKWLIVDDGEPFTMNDSQNGLESH